MPAATPWRKRAAALRELAGRATVDAKLRLEREKGEDTMKLHARVLAAASFACSTLLGAAAAQAQDFPDRPVRIIVPAAAGGAIDAAGRILAQGLTEHWGGRPVVVENRVGASMVIGATAVAQAKPDGYTLLVAHDGVMAVNPHFVKNITYDSRKDFAGVGIIARLPLALFVHESVPAKNVQEFIAYAKASPGKLNHGSGGPASLLALELFKAMTGVQVVNVNYRGSALSINDLLSNTVQFVFADIASGGAALQSSSVRTLGVTSMERATSLPNVPTIHEAGLANYDTATWIGAFAPRGVERAVQERLESAVTAAARSEAVRKRLLAIGMEPAALSGREAEQVVASDLEKWGKLIREQNIQFAQ